MKRAIISLFIILLFINFVYAVDILNVSKNSSIDFKGKSNEVLEKEVKIPDNLQIFARVLFGLKNNEKINFNTFIIFTLIWIIFLILLRSIVLLMPFFNKNTSWLGSIIIMLLIGVSGGLEVITKFILWIGSLFGILKDWKIFSLIISLIVVFGLAILISKGMKMLGLSEEIEKMKGRGRNIGIASEIGRIESESLKKK